MKSMRKLLIALLLLLGCAFLFSRITDLQQVAETLRKGDWRWLLFALAIQLAYVVNTGASFWAIYRLLGMNEKIERLTLLAQAANFVIVIAPSAGMGGIAVFAADARKRGHSTGRVTTAAALFVLYDYLATLIVVLMGLLVLFRRDKLHASEISAAVFILLLAIALASLLYLGMQSGEKLAAALAWIGSRINRVLGIFTKRKQLDLESARNFALDAAEGLVQARRSPDGLLLPFALAMSNKALMMAILFLMFLAFGQPFSIGTLVAGYAVGYLFTRNRDDIGIEFLAGPPCPRSINRAWLSRLHPLAAIPLRHARHPLGRPLERGGSCTRMRTSASRSQSFFHPLITGSSSLNQINHIEQQLQA